MIYFIKLSIIPIIKGVAAFPATPSNMLLIVFKDSVTIILLGLGDLICELSVSISETNSSNTNLSSVICSLIFSISLIIFSFFYFLYSLLVFYKMGANISVIAASCDYFYFMHIAIKQTLYVGMVKGKW